MMLLILFNLILFCSASVDDVLNAKMPEEVEHLHKIEEEAGILQQRCEIELREALFPSNCMLWVQKIPMGQGQKKFIRTWIESNCVKSLKQDVSQVSLHLKNLEKVNGVCRQQMRIAVKNWIYKALKEGNSSILDSLKSGKDFEMLLSDETVATQKQNKPYNLRTIR